MLKKVGKKMNTDDIFCMIVQERMKKININSATLRYIEKVDINTSRRAQYDPWLRKFISCTSST